MACLGCGAACARWGGVSSCREGIQPVATTERWHMVEQGEGALSTCCMDGVFGGLGREGIQAVA